MARRAFLSSETARNGQPSAVAADIVALMDALRIEKATLAGFDWGARTADNRRGAVAGRAKALVPSAGTLIGSQEAGKMPLPPKAELDWWYQFYFAHRARPRRLRQVPARFCETDLATRIAEMEFRRRHLRSQRCPRLRIPIMSRS